MVAGVEVVVSVAEREGETLERTTEVVEGPVVSGFVTRKDRVDDRLGRATEGRVTTAERREVIAAATVAAAAAAAAAGAEIER